MRHQITTRAFLLFVPSNKSHVTPN